MIKKILVFTLALTSTTSSLFCQIRFNDIITFEGKTYIEIQAYLLNDFEIIDETKSYAYQPIMKCKPHVYQSDSCAWKCHSPTPEIIRSAFPINSVVFKDVTTKNYMIFQNFESKFAENFNVNTKEATTFIFVQEGLEFNNGNCKNEMQLVRKTIKIDIQFADETQWTDFKQSTINNSKFLRTYKPYEGGPTESIYGILRKTINGYNNGTMIRLSKNLESPIWHASISYNTFLD